MGTSFVEYKGFGFWTRDKFLESWFLTLLKEMENLPSREAWQEALIEHWRIQAGVDGGVMAVDLDEFLTDKGREAFLLSLTRRALGRSDPIGTPNRRAFR